MKGNVPLVAIKNLRKNYNGKTALAGINLTIARGKITGLLGPNGSGKSTLLKTICGLVKPTGGTVLVDGVPPGMAAKEKISYLPEIDHLYSWMSVRETLDFISTFYSNWDAEKAAELLQFMGLEEDMKVRNLSKGLRARLKLVVALARKVPLILLDEPLSGIDPPSRTRILRSIVSQYREGEQSVLLSTHEILEAESIFEDVIFLQNGIVKLNDSAENLREIYGCSIQELWEEVYDS